MADRFDIAIIGGGIVGLAVARELVGRRPGLGVVVLEKEGRLAAHQTGHNSGVVHSGIYYRPGSLKARLCVAGAARMKAFCRERGLPLLECGKVIVATRDEELPRLEELGRRAAANGVPGAATVGPERLRELEPHAAGLRALHIPGVAAVDYGAVTAAFADDVRRAGGVVRTGVEILAVRRETPLRLETSAGDLLADRLVACAGLHADRVARRAGERPDVRIIPFRGEYYTLAPEAERLVRGLIYPVPDPELPFLGVHFTRHVTKGVEAGPNAVLALKREGYRWTDVSPADLADTAAWPGFWRMARRNIGTGFDEILRSFNRRRFARDLQRLVPGIRKEDLLPGGSGVRAQAVDREGKLVDDFRLAFGDRTVHVLNAPSPAATASLAIAEYIVDEMSQTGRTDP